MMRIVLCMYIFASTWVCQQVRLKQCWPQFHTQNGARTMSMAETLLCNWSYTVYVCTLLDSLAATKICEEQGVYQLSA